jgi:hypothetical protein
MTTLNVSDETHSNVLKLQAALNLTSTSGKYTLDATVNTAVTQCLGGASFSFVQQPAAPMAYTTSFSSQAMPTSSCYMMGTTTSSGVARFSLRSDK